MPSCKSFGQPGHVIWIIPAAAASIPLYRFLTKHFLLSHNLFLLKQIDNQKCALPIKAYPINTASWKTDVDNLEDSKAIFPGVKDNPNLTYVEDPEHLNSQVVLETELYKHLVWLAEAHLIHKDVSTTWDHQSIVMSQSKYTTSSNSMTSTN